MGLFKYPYLEGLVGFTITGLVVGFGLPQPHPLVTSFMGQNYFCYVIAINT
jgi:hypothetical protein